MADGGIGEKIVDEALKKRRQPPPSDEQQERPREPYVLTPAQCTALPPRNRIIKGLIASGDHTGLIGLPGSGKSAVAPRMGYHVALGLPIFGRRVRQMPVLYLASEDGQGMAARVAALYATLGDAPAFMLQPVPLDLFDPNRGHIEAVWGLIRAYRPGLIFLDTIARSFPGLKENDNDGSGMSVVVAVARGFTTICNSAVISLHHPPKTGENTPRGGGVLDGDFDTTFFVEGKGTAPRTVTLGKNRNGPSDATFSFNIGVHDFGPDEDGDPVTAPVAEPLDDAPMAGKAAKEAKLGDKPAVMLRELRGLIETHGAIVQPGEGYPSVRGVTRVQLRSRLIDRAWFAEDLLFAGQDGRTTLDRKGFGPESTALTALKRRGLASYNREAVWLT